MTEREEFPIYLHCDACGRTTRHLLHFAGSEARSLDCTNCGRVIAVNDAEGAKHNA